MHMKWLVALALVGLAIFATSLDVEARGGGGKSGGSSAGAPPGYHNVRGYYRRDGTYVRPRIARNPRRRGVVRETETTTSESQTVVRDEGSRYTGPLIAEILQPQVLVYRRRYVPMVENGVVVDRPASRRRVIRVRTSDRPVVQPQAIRARTSVAPAAAARTTDVEHVPQYNVEGWCRLVANSSNSYQLVHDNCVEAEQAALAELRTDWSKVSVNMRRWCDQVARAAAAGSYSTLRSCVRMEANAAPAAAPAPATSKPAPAATEQDRPQ